MKMNKKLRMHKHLSLHTVTELRILHPYVSATSVHYSLVLKMPMQHVCSLLFLQEGSPCARILPCRRTCAACPFCCCTVILPYSPWHNEQMKTSCNDPTDSEIAVSDFACASSAPSILMRTRFLGPKKPRKGCALDLRKYGINSIFTCLM